MKTKQNNKMQTWTRKIGVGTTMTNGKPLVHKKMMSGRLYQKRPIESVTNFCDRFENVNGK